MSEERKKEEEGTNEGTGGTKEGIGEEGNKEE